MSRRFEARIRTLEAQTPEQAFLALKGLSALLADAKAHPREPREWDEEEDQPRRGLSQLLHEARGAQP